jgi:Fe-S cluster assembly ATP-binding protein
MGKTVSKLLSIKNLKVAIKDKIILNDINLEIKSGQIHALMGPNGSGKTTLAHTLMGNTKYKITQGEMLFDGKNLNELDVAQRAKLGIFLAFQHPYEIEGVSVKELLRNAYNSITQKPLDLENFKKLLQQKAESLDIPPALLERGINVGFSGGEKKLFEILQMAILQPKLVILDEIDSGLDIDALKIVCDSLNKIKKDLPETSFLIITHYPRILNYLKPDFVHLMQNGKITKSGDFELAQEIEKFGYNEPSLN